MDHLVVVPDGAVTSLRRLDQLRRHLPAHHRTTTSDAHLPARHRASHVRHVEAAQGSLTNAGAHQRLRPLCRLGFRGISPRIVPDGKMTTITTANTPPRSAHARTTRIAIQPRSPGSQRRRGIEPMFSPAKSRSSGVTPEHWRSGPVCPQNVTTVPTAGWTKA